MPENNSESSTAVYRKGVLAAQNMNSISLLTFLLTQPVPGPLY